MTDCPKCNGDTTVINSRGNGSRTRRRRVCVNCGHRFSTIEIEEDALKFVTEIEGLFARRGDFLKRLLGELPPKPPKPKFRRLPGRSIGERMEKRRGCLVPPEQEADWKLLKSKGYTPAEAARVLGLRFTLPTRASK